MTYSPFEGLHFNGPMGGLASCGLGFSGLGVGFQGLAFRISGLGFKVWGSGLRVKFFILSDGDWSFNWA